MRLTVQPVRVRTGHDEEGCLVFTDGRLIAVLVQLSGTHGELAGQWYHEAGFGSQLDGPQHPTFPDLDAAQAWIAARLG